MSTILSQLKPLKIGDLTAKLPIIQGGMGVGISLSSLAGAVAGAGGIGIISTAQIGFREPDFAEHPQEAKPARDRFRVTEGARDREGRHRGL